MGKSFTDKLNNRFNTFDDNILPDEITCRFYVLELLAGNDLSDTYLLSCKKTGKKFVLKKFHHTELYSESDLLSGLSHKGLPRFEPHIISDGSLFTLREYINGISLDEFLSESSDTGTEVIAGIVIELCDAIHLLHSQPIPIIHRDIKPSNVVIDTERKFL